MIQPTSTAAYRELKIGPRQRLVYHALEEYGSGHSGIAVTNLEISTWKKIPINQVTPRMNELVKMGYVVKSHVRRCSVSGRMAIAWRVQHG